MQSIEKQIENIIKSKPKGYLVLATDFMQYGTAKAVQKSLFQKMQLRNLV